MKPRVIDNGHLGKVNTDDAGRLIAMETLRRTMEDIDAGGDGRIVMIGTYEPVEQQAPVKRRKWWQFWRRRTSVN